MSDPVVDPMVEIDAMKAVADAVDNLDPTTRARVLRWATERYSLSPRTPSGQQRDLPEDGGNNSTSTPSGEFESAAELLAAADAQTESDRALVIGYWFQSVLGQTDIEAHAVNTEHKHQGHGLSNVTRAFDGLIGQRPQLVIQVRKSGAARQARKKYKLTTMGIQRVRRMLQESTNNGGDA